MLQLIRPYSSLAIYLLLVSYTWTFCKAPICDFFYSIAHTASVMNANLYETHNHSQEIAVSDLELFKNAVEEDQNENKRKSINLEQDKQVKIFNDLIPLNQLEYQEYTSNFPASSFLKKLYQTVILPPPQLV